MNNQLTKPIEICIPRVSNTITRTQIFDIFKKMKIGYIQKIIENPLKSNTNFKRIIIKINWDNTQALAIELQEKLKNNKPINIVYDMPWYWKVVANNPQN